MICSFIIAHILVVLNKNWSWRRGLAQQQLVSSSESHQAIWGFVTWLKKRTNLLDYSKSTKKCFVSRLKSPSQRGGSRWSFLDSTRLEKLISPLIFDSAWVGYKSLLDLACAADFRLIVQKSTWRMVGNKLNATVYSSRLIFDSTPIHSL